ncbi:MAG: hypothetical protein GY893_14365 [bacterium]|nr:hypothetical protein [bacterium]
MGVVQRKAMLKSEGFFPHKKNAKGTTIIYSRKHPTAKFVRVVIDSGIDSKTNKVVGKVGIKLCFVNRQKSWREITAQIFTTNTGLVKTIKAQEAAEKFVKTCKHCKAKKFTAKSGNVVCANACWTAWGGKKKSANTTKKSSQKTTAQNIGPRELRDQARQKKSQKVTPKSQRTYPLNKTVQKKAQKKRQKIVAEILPGDLVSIERIELDTFKEDYTGRILGIVMSVTKEGRVNVNWTANTSNLESWDLPFTNHYATDYRHVLRFKVLSRNVEWAEAA